MCQLYETTIKQSNAVNSHIHLCYICTVLQQSHDFPEVDGDPWANHTLSATLKGPPLQNAKKPLSAIGEKLRDGRSPLVNCSIWSLICFLSVSRLPVFQEMVWCGTTETNNGREGRTRGRKVGKNPNIPLWKSTLDSYLQNFFKRFEKGHCFL